MERELNEISEEKEEVNVENGERLYQQYQKDVNQRLAEEDPESGNKVDLDSFFEDSLKSQFHVFFFSFIVSFFSFKVLMFLSFTSFYLF